MVTEEIKKRMREYRPQIIDTLGELVAIPTSNPPGSYYKQCVDYLSSKLKEFKIDYEIINIPHGDYSRLLILGAYGNGQKSIHFHGHYDVVPANTSDQFKPYLRGGRLYGRGSSDMKSGLVVILFALRLIRELDKKLEGKIYFSLVPDEETGGKLGTRYLFGSELWPLDGALGMLMPEPTSGVIWKANKGALTYRIEIKGKAAHVGLEHQGINAFEQMVRTASSLMKLKKEIQKRRMRFVFLIFFIMAFITSLSFRLH